MMKFLYPILLLLALPVWADNSYWQQTEHSLDKPVEIKVYHDPNCQCCQHWIAHLKQHHFKVIDVLSNNMMATKQSLGLPLQKGLASCHTAIVDGYLIEGHVPAGDIKRLLTEKPAIKGLAVPDMPIGTPGMDMGPKRQAFAVLQFDHDDNVNVYHAYTLDNDHHYQSAPVTDQ